MGVDLIKFELKEEPVEYITGDEEFHRAVCVQGKPEVTVAGALTLVRDGKVLLSLDATYDFSEIPPEQHALALWALQTVLPRTRLSVVI